MGNFLLKLLTVFSDSNNSDYLYIGSEYLPNSVNNPY